MPPQPRYYLHSCTLILALPVFFHHIMHQLRHLNPTFHGLKPCLRVNLPVFTTSEPQYYLHSVFFHCITNQFCPLNPPFHGLTPCLLISLPALKTTEPQYYLHS